MTHVVAIYLSIMFLKILALNLSLYSCGTISTLSLVATFSNFASVLFTMLYDKKLLIKMSTSFDVIVSPILVIICIK